MATYNIAVKTVEGSHIEIPSNVIIPTRYMDGDVIAIADEAFKGCTDLISITLPQNTIRIGEDAFNGCTGLTFIDIPAKVVYMGARAFEGCTQLKKINVNASASSVVSWPVGWNGEAEVAYLPEPTYKITVSKTGSGTVSVKPSAIQGEEVTISLTPANGYNVSSVTINGVILEAENGQYTFEMPNKDVTISVIFEKIVINNNPYFFYGDTHMSNVSIASISNGYELSINYFGTDTPPILYTSQPVQSVQVKSGDDWLEEDSWSRGTNLVTISINGSDLQRYETKYNGADNPGGVETLYRFLTK